MKKLFRISTVPMSLNLLLKGQLRYLNQFYDVTAISGAGKDMDEVQNREQVKTQVIEMAREISPFQDLMALYRLYCYFKKEKPDIIHSITPKAGLLSMLAGKFAGVPIRMHTFTGLIFPSKKGIFKTVLIGMDRLLAGCATHIYPEGEGVKEDLIKYCITQKPLKMIANGNVNGIDTAYFNRNEISTGILENLKADLGIEENDFVFIFVGRLVRDKGINELIAAFSNLNLNLNLNLNFNLKLLLVGPLEAELDPLLPQTLQEIATNPNIISVGFQKDVRPYFLLSDALVFPSYREGFPNVVLQSLALQVPAIVTDINGSNEIITHGKNGLIVPPKNASELQKAMERLLTDRALRENLRAYSQQSVLRFEQKLVWEALLAEYQMIDGD